jgi:hypothetical protein
MKIIDKIKIWNIKRKLKKQAKKNPENVMSYAIANAWVDKAIDICKAWSNYKGKTKLLLLVLLFTANKRRMKCQQEQ